ncbi:MAG: hypothetical protein R3223_06855 [Longimicrobiales bacterium]|nr:hypothetical protein [Longimicrobiales bacterium]
MREHENPSGFEALDPARGNPGYWERFQDRTLALVEPELVRRRQALERMTVADVVMSWSRAVVPMAMVAAVAALMVLSADAVVTEMDGAASVGSAVERSEVVRSPTASSVEAPVEDTEGLDGVVDGGPIPALAEEDLDDMPVVLTVAVEGF